MEASSLSNSSYLNFLNTTYDGSGNLDVIINGQLGDTSDEFTIVDAKGRDTVRKDGFFKFTVIDEGMENPIPETIRTLTAEILKTKVEKFKEAEEILIRGGKEKLPFLSKYLTKGNDLISGGLSKAGALIPSSEKTGTVGGYVVSAMWGTEMILATVDFVASQLIANPYARYALVKAAMGVVTSTGVATMMPAAGALAGAFLLPLAVKAVYAVFSKHSHEFAAASKALNNEEAKKLLEAFKPSGKEIIAKEEYEKLKKILNIFDQLYSRGNQKDKTRKEIREIIDQHFIMREDGKFFFRDGLELKDAEMKILKKGTRALISPKTEFVRDENKSKQKIEDLIEMIAKHTLSQDADIECKDGGGTYNLYGEEVEADYYFKQAEELIEQELKELKKRETAVRKLNNEVREDISYDLKKPDEVYSGDDDELNDSFIEL